MAKPHEVLGLQPGATFAEVRAAYRRQAQIAHPDRPGGSAEQFHRVQAAYDALRAKHSGGMFDDIFSDIAKELKA